MTRREALRLKKGTIVYDKRTGHPFEFLKSVKVWDGMLLLSELKDTPPRTELACALIKGHDYEGEFYTNGPFITFKPRQLFIPSKCTQIPMKFHL